MTETKAGPPLGGLKVVELARILAGPWIGQTLADLGAQVIKVEAPQGDDTRRWKPPKITRPHPAGGEEEVATYFHAANRGKTSVTCDLTQEADLAQLKALIAEADIFIENFKVGGLAKFGLDYSSLAEAHPRLIYASVTGFGQTGPRAAQPGYDLILQGMSGIMDLTGEREGTPQRVGVAWIDIFTGLYGVIGIQAALAERERSGLGQQIDLSLFDTGLAVLANQATSALLGGTVPHRMGNAHPSIVPYQVFEVADGHIVIACGNDRQFKALAAVLGHADWSEQPDYATNPARVAARTRLVPMIEAETRTWAREDLIAALDSAGVPAGPINNVAEALEDPQSLARGLVVTPEGLPSVRTPLVFSRSSLSLPRAAPTLGSGTWHFDGPDSETQ